MDERGERHGVGVCGFLGRDSWREGVEEGALAAVRNVYGGSAVSD